MNSNCQPLMNSSWPTLALWEEANQTVALSVRRHRRALAAAKKHAVAARENLETIFPPMTALCKQTCGDCPEPCCRRACVWFDFKDLIFFHLTEAFIPPSPLIRGKSESCPSLGPAGCLLPRLSRPWICNWYLCPSQFGIIRQRSEQCQNRLKRHILSIKTERAKMEDAFLRAVA